MNCKTTADLQLKEIAQELNNLADFCEDDEWIQYRLEQLSENAMPNIARLYGEVAHAKKQSKPERAA